MLTLLKLGGLAVAIVAFITKEVADAYRSAKRLEVSRRVQWGYRAIVIAGMIAGIVGAALEIRAKARTDGKRAAVELASDGRAIFHDGLTTNAPQRIELSFPKLLAALPALSRYPELRSTLIGATHDLALGTERVAYGTNNRGCLYFHDGSSIQACFGK